MLLTSGTLFIKLQSATLTRNTEWLGKMDPYVKVSIGNQSERTKTHLNGGKKPRWEQTLKFKIVGSTDEEIKIQVFDEESVKSDDLVGETSFFMDDIKRRGKFQEATKIAYNGKEAGILK